MGIVPGFGKSAQDTMAQAGGAETGVGTASDSSNGSGTANAGGNGIELGLLGQ